MKKTLLSLLAILAMASSLSAQHLELTMGAGAFNIPSDKNFLRPQAGTNINFGMHYSINEHWNIGTNYNLGHIRFSNPVPHPVYNPFNMSMNWAGEGWVQQENFSFLLIRKVDLPWWGLRFEAGTGLGFVLRSSTYYKGYNWNEEHQAYMGVGMTGDTLRELHLPLNYGIKKNLFDKVVIGMTGGQFFNPRLNTSGGFHGLSFGYLL
jgi:hypothetical protein